VAGLNKSFQLFLDSCGMAVLEIGDLKEGNCEEAGGGGIGDLRLEI
jgi:hypothetical protein